MRPTRIAIMVGAGLTLLAGRASAQSFQVTETSIGDIHAAMHAGTLTCHGLAQQYLNRIQAYDQQGPKLNAMLYVNPNALQQADAMDEEFKRTGKLKPLGCIPIVLKDNYDTMDMPTTAGSILLKGSIPERDAFVVSRLRANGALILGKANLQEFALGGITVSSLGGQTRNPYDLTKTPGGSSGGTAAAVAANFAAAGTGSDTGGSIRSPSSATSLVGIRPSAGLISRDGIVPISITQDTIGPLTRTVADGARMLDAMTGYDPNDPITALSAGHIPPSYTRSLENGLKGARIGVLKTLFGEGPDYEEVNQVMTKAIGALKEQGAVIVPVEDAGLDTNELLDKVNVEDFEFKTQIKRYLESQGSRVAVHSLDEIIASGKFDRPTLEKRLAVAQSRDENDPEYKNRRIKIDALKIEVANLMAQNRLVALVYPYQKRLVVRIGETFQPDRNGILAALTGFPAIVVPAGFSAHTATALVGVPVGIEFIGRPWEEPELLRLAYGFEQATHARKSPVSAPAVEIRQR
jgi:amidase